MIIDWSRAPDWAQELATNPYNEKAWLGDEGYSYLVGNGGVVPWSYETAFARTAFKSIEHRPEPWTGEGLPPVGAVCEMHRETYFEIDWQPVTLLCVGQAKAFFRDKEGCEWSRPLRELSFRPIRTPEQIAADQRLHDIRNALTAIKAGQQQFPNDLVRGNIVVATVEAMIDAGYRKQVAP